MSSKIHILGNGDLASLMPDQTKAGNNGKVITCNVPPFAVKSYATVIGDFKMMRAIHEGSINLDVLHWVLGNRPKSFCEKNPAFYMKHAHRIREFYTEVPKYCGDTAAKAATNFNCGHFATHYGVRRHNATECHMYGFDSLFDHNMRSFTDTVLKSDRGNNNNERLLTTWRPIWGHIFREFKDTKFVLWHKHNTPKIEFPDNVEIFVPKRGKK